MNTDDAELEEVLEDMELDDEPWFSSENVQKRNIDTIGRFLGKEKQTLAPITFPRYYRELLMWALQHYIETETWEIVEVLGHRGRMPRYADVNTDYGKYENILCDGYLLLQKGHIRLVSSIKTSSRQAPSLVILSCEKKEGIDFAGGIREFVTENNPYKGKKLRFTSQIRFLTLPPRRWQDLTLDPVLKNEIENNTIGFLGRMEELAKYGISSRRGLILVGEPGTGKTLICKVLMNHSPDITCILSDGSCLTNCLYISYLYELAQDLRPTIVFIEDIDLIAEERRESHYTRAEALASLLCALDGVEECKEVVTVATTNFIETIDKALSERPSRFDRIIRLPLPSLERRKELISSLSCKIPMDDAVQEYLAQKTHNYTPAQIQEVAYSLAIEHKHCSRCYEVGNCQFTVGDVDNVLAKINHTKQQFGFKKMRGNGNGLGDEIAQYTSIRRGVDNFKEGKRAETINDDTRNSYTSFGR
jgi:cell division protease FtsH